MNVPLFPPIQMCAPVIGSGCALILSAGAGRCPVVFLKAAGKSVLIVKTEQRCNKRYRHIGFRKHLTGLFQFQCCQKLLGGTLIFFAEAARQMVRVYTEVIRHFTDGKPFRIPGFKIGLNPHGERGRISGTHHSGQFGSHVIKNIIHGSLCLKVICGVRT